MCVLCAVCCVLCAVCCVLFLDGIPILIGSRNRDFGFLVSEMSGRGRRQLDQLRVPRISLKVSVFYAYINGGTIGSPAPPPMRSAWGS